MKTPDDFIFDIVKIQRSNKLKAQKVLDMRELLYENEEYLCYASGLILSSIPDDPREFREVH